MERIKSFSVNHMTLLPGVYLSREDAVYPDGTAKSAYPISTYDIRMTRPNFEPVMGTGEIHTIEHLGATYLRNRDDIKKQVLYWGPMGCRTGFYLIMAGEIPVEEIKRIMTDLFTFVSDFEGDIPGAAPEECGNYSDMDLPAARLRAARYLDVLK